MKLLEKIKLHFLKKKNSNLSNSSRKIVLKNADEFLCILIITNSNNELFFKSAENNFKNAELNALYVRQKKEDLSAQFRFSVHQSDFNLTGGLKNDKLTKLIQKKFDLIVDLSDNSELLNYFLRTIQSDLIVGKLGSSNENLYDLFFESASDESDFLLKISTQLNHLNHGHQ